MPPNHSILWHKRYRYLSTLWLLATAWLIGCTPGFSLKEAPMPEVGIPLMDQNPPTHYETATFALG